MSDGRQRVVAWAVLLALCAGRELIPARARAQDGADSVGAYLRARADSTDFYFGVAAAPADTAGLDSALAFRLTHTWPYTSRRSRLALGPWLSFDRVDGPRWGGGAKAGDVRRRGEISGRIGYAAGSNAWRGAGEVALERGARREDGPRWTLGARAGRLTAALDPDHPESWLRVPRALLDGSDRQHYLRRDGFRAAIEREAPHGRAGLGVRTELESPLVTTAAWTLFGRAPGIVFNLPAVRGRAAEARAELAARLPGLPLQGEAVVAIARRGLGGDFDYQRLRLALGGEFALASLAALVPQLEYGRLTGDSPPQASFFLGGTHSLRSLPAGTLGGTAKACARLEAIFAPDLLALARLPHPAAFPIQGSLFAGSGAVWGRDPFGGPGTAEGGWPARGAWRSEAGASLLYRPGIPDPVGFFRLDYARSLGASHEGRVSIDFSVPLDLLRPLP